MKKTIHTPNLARVTAILCAVAALFSIISFFAGDATAPIKSLNRQIESTKQEIISNEERIVTLEQDIETYQKNLADTEATLPAAKAELDKANTDLSTAQTAYKQAQNALDAVCSRYYYSSYSCTEECKPLHDAEDAQYKVVSKAKETVTACEENILVIESRIETAKKNIADAQEDIANAEDQIVYLQDELSQLRGQLVGAWLGMLVDILAIMIVIGALVLFAKCFFSGTIDMLGLFACAGLATVSALYLFVGLIDESITFWAMFIHPHAWNIVIMGCFAATMTKQHLNQVALRTVAIVAAVILAGLGFATGNAFVAALYAAAMICASFLFVPLVYTEYIPMAKHIFLSLITCGIWVLVWIYQVTKALNKVEKAEERRPGWELFLCMFLPFYGLYWLLKTAENVELYGAEKEKTIKLDMVVLAIGLICPLFATVLIQNKINLIVGKPVPAAVEAVTEAPAEAPAEEPAAEAVEAE